MILNKHDLLVDLEDRVNQGGLKNKYFCVNRKNCPIEGFCTWHAGFAWSALF